MFLTFYFIGGIVAFVILLKMALDGKLTPKEDWTAISADGKYERFHRKRKREDL
jgi:hypothetical protein